MKIKINEKTALRFYALEAGDAFMCGTDEVFIKLAKKYQTFSQTFSHNAVSLKTGECRCFPPESPVKFYDGEIILEKEKFKE